MNSKAIAARLFRFARKQRNLSQQQLAIKLKVNPSTISKVEHEMHLPSALLIRRLKQLMKMNTRDLVRLSRFN